MTDEEKLTVYQRLRNAGIDRPWNDSDVQTLLKNEHGTLVFNLDLSVIYTVEFQEWFISGLMKCENHPYPFQWHRAVRPYCVNCHPELTINFGVPMNYRQRREFEAK